MIQKRIVRSILAKRPLFIAAIFIIFALIASFFPLNRAFNFVGYLIQAPVRFILKSEGIIGDRLKISSAQFMAKRNLAEENLILSRRIMELSQTAVYNSALELQINALRGALEVPEKADVEFIPAIVLSKPPRTPFDILLIDVGASNGVEIGDKVFYGKVVLGTVSRVSSRLSEVALFSTPGAITTVALGDRGIITEVSGYGGGILAAKLPKDVKTEIGDMVMLPDASGRLPFFVGSVGAIIGESTDTFHTLLINLAANPYELTAVSVEKKREGVVEVAE